MTIDNSLLHHQPNDLDTLTTVQDFPTLLKSSTDILLDRLEWYISGQFKRMEEASKQLEHNIKIRDRCAQITCVSTYPFKAVIGIVGIGLTVLLGTGYMCLRSIYESYECSKNSWRPNSSTRYHTEVCINGCKEGCDIYRYLCGPIVGNCICALDYNDYILPCWDENGCTLKHNIRLRGTIENCRLNIEVYTSKYAGIPFFPFQKEEEREFLKKRIAILLEPRYLQNVNETLLRHPKYTTYLATVNIIQLNPKATDSERSALFLTTFALLGSEEESSQNLIINMYRFTIASENLLTIKNFPKELLSIMADYLI